MMLSVTDYLFVGIEEPAVSINVVAAAVSSTVVAFIVISLLTFIAGFVCGHYLRRKHIKATSSQPVPLKFNVLLSDVEHQE